MVPRLLEKKGIDESRHGSRARPRHRRGFFCDSRSNLEIDEAFQISHKLGLGLAAKFSKAWVSEWGNFLFNFHGQYDMIHNDKTTTSMHILIKGPPSFSGPDRQILLPPLGGVWPRPGSGILVYLPPGLGHPRTPTPPPHTKLSRVLPIWSFLSQYTLNLLVFFLFYLIVTTVYPPPPKTTSLDPKSRGAARGHRPSMPMTPVWTSISLGLFPMVERIHDDDIKKKKNRKNQSNLLNTVHITSRIANKKKKKKTPPLRRSKQYSTSINCNPVAFFQCCM